MKALIVYGSKTGGTEGLARWLGEALAEHGWAETVRSGAEHTSDLSKYDVVVVGGALRMFRWHKDARRFVRRNARELRGKQVWFFSSGPTDKSAAHAETIPPTKEVSRLMEQAGVTRHRTFGGRMNTAGRWARWLPPESLVDHRDKDDVRHWADEIVGHTAPTS